MKFHRFSYLAGLKSLCLSMEICMAKAKRSPALFEQLINNFHFIFISKFDLITWKSCKQRVSGTTYHFEWERTEN